VVVKLEITPEPSEDERAAIVAAVAQETETPASAWPETVLPWRDDPPEP
jgi:invasion protein IalB